ncbi:ABC transporter permease [candidate division KSB1 bacterium]
MYKYQKLYTSLNLAGLAAGITCCILIMIYILDELSFDSFYTNSDNIYRITFRSDLSPDYQPHFARCPHTWIVNLPEDFPEVMALARFHHARSVIQYENKKFNEERFFVTDPRVFDVFNFSFVGGNENSSFENLNTLLITESMALKYFGEVDPVGRTMNVLNHFQLEKQDFTVTGVIKDIPQNSHFHFDFLANLGSERKSLINEWNYVYIVLTPGYNPDDLEEKLPGFIEKYGEENSSETQFFHLQPLRDIHLKSHIDRELEANGDIKYIYIFSFASIFILLIASINYVNLSTARVERRRKEVGMRKLLGAQRGQLFVYFLGESIIFCCCAIMIALIAAIYLLPLFNNLTGKAFTLSHITDFKILISIICFPIVFGMYAGCYQALYLSSFRPLDLLLKGREVKKILWLGKNTGFREFLVVVQFSISIALIICTVIIYSQIDYINTRNVGYVTDSIIAVIDNPFQVMRGFESLRNELLPDPQILGVSASMVEPSKEILDAGIVTAEGVDQNPQNPVVYYGGSVSENFFEIMKIAIISGRNFFPGVKDDSTESYILNEEAVKSLGWNSPEDAVGKRFKWRDRNPGQVIGVVENVHYTSLHKRITPLVFVYKPEWLSCILIAIDPEREQQALSTVQAHWNNLFPDYPFDYVFLDDLLEQSYESEVRQGEIIGVFSLLSILISCLGLYGLAAFSAEQRTREISIRKVLGATVPGMIFLLTKDAFKWILIANVVAWPVSWYVMSMWLQDFAYRINITLIPFIFTGTLALVVALLTVSYQTVNAAAANPVDTLKYE